jgi:hypothetical protein
VQATLTTVNDSNQPSQSDSEAEISAAVNIDGYDNNNNPPIIINTINDNNIDISNNNSTSPPSTPSTTTSQPQSFDSTIFNNTVPSDKDCMPAILIDTVIIDSNQASQSETKSSDVNIDDHNDVNMYDDNATDINNNNNNNSNNNKWTSIHLTRSSAIPTHPFFTSLPKRSGYRARHLVECYLPTASMCSCQRFPMLSHQLPSSTTYSATTTIPDELDHLCISCIKEFCISGPAVSVLKRYWTRELEAVHAAYYERFYTEEELEDIKETEHVEYRIEKTLDKAILLCKKHGYERIGWKSRYTEEELKRLYAKWGWKRKYTKEEEEYLGRT